MFYKNGVKRNDYESKNKLKNQNLNKGTLVDQLKELTELYESGALTKEQFEAAKKIVLGK